MIKDMQVASTENGHCENLNNQIAELLDERFQNMRISYDGVVDENTFQASPYRVMFLLKDVNDNGHILDWRQYMNTIRQEAINHTAGWQNVCRLMEVLDRPEAVYNDCLDENGNYNVNALQKHMKEISIVNIKKTLGRGVNDQDTLKTELTTAVNEYGDVILHEIELIKPRLVVCGGTFKHAMKILHVQDSKFLHDGAEYFVSHKHKTLYLSFYHPGAHIQTNVMFCYAKAVFPQAIDKMKELGIISD